MEAKGSPPPMVMAGLVLAVLTGVIHLYIGATAPGNPAVPEGDRTGTAVAFLGMGTIYIVGAALAAANIRRDLWVRVGIGWVVLLLGAWGAAAAAGFPGTRTGLAYLDKAVEIVLLGILIALVRKRRKGSPTPVAA